MRLILPIIVSVLVLAGCADDYEKSADANCRRAPDKQAKWEIVGPGVVSLGMDMPTKKRLGIANPNQVATDATTCVRNDNNKENKPQSHDLQKIGVALPPGIDIRL
jgi:hypothetical protein